MKKLIMLVTVVLFVLALSACKKDNTLKVGMELLWPPFETIDSEGNPAGISVDLAYALGEYLGRDVEIVDVPFGSLITALETGEIDVIIGSMSITEERALKINFSEPYFYFPLITILNKDFNDSHSITSKEDLFGIDGVKFVGQKSFVSLSIPQAEALNPVILEVNDANSAVLEVISGAADAFIISASSAAGYQAANPDTTEILWSPIMLSPIGMGIAKENTQLLSDVNDFIAGLETSGVYDMLREKYDDIIAEDLPGQGLDFYIYD
ncbi:MAG: transporter substrate-binding domain-containing protein [Firmicutes bacterium]|nr:transporter substrate-binding domain-containing protein [Bacillota bacterium]